MKKAATKNPSKQSPIVKEISEGVYINLNRIPTDEKEFEKAIEESFKDLEKEDSSEILKRAPSKSTS